MKWIEPDWPAPANVRALSTIRDGGASEGVFAGLNLGAHVGDEPARVEANRARLQQVAAIPGPLNWLNQVHGTIVHPVSSHYQQAPDADAACAHEVDQACIVMTADCLPVLFCDRAGTVVAAEILAWLGPAIGPTAFEVGGEVREAFMAEQAEAAAAFVPSSNEGKWLADIYQLARLRLARAGVTAVYGGEYCTFSDSEQFYSYRRNGQTGRMASIIWLAS